MKLQIKTLNQKSLIVDIEETKTVYDLKKELSLYADVGVQPDQQKLIYGGKILKNTEPLSTYNIDIKKYLVIMILKQPHEELKIKTNEYEEQQNAQGGDVSVGVTQTLFTSNASNDDPSEMYKLDVAAALPGNNGEGDDIDLLQRIVSMGYPEQDVRNALRASFNDPNRAIEYLIEGIPATVSNINTNTVATSTAAASTNTFGGNFQESSVESSANETSVLDLFRNSREFMSIRRAVLQNSELLDAGIQQVAETNPAFLELIDQHQGEFLATLMEDFDNDSEDDGGYLNDDEDDNSS